MSDEGLNHVLRLLTRAITDLIAQQSITSRQLGVLINQGEAQAAALERVIDVLESIEVIVTPPEPIGATAGTLYFYAQGSSEAMDTFNPKTTVDFVAEFDKADGTQGRIDGAAVVTDDNGNDVVTVTDDGAATGTCKGSIDGSKNVGADPKEVSNIKVTGDGNLGAGSSLVVLEGSITWDSDEVSAAGGKVTFTARPATPPEATAFRAAVAKRRA